jgi:CRISPR-associated protein Cmr1
MERKLPPLCPSAPAVSDDDRYPGQISKSFDFSIVTPIFGGGVEAGANDPITLIRPSGIRGQLRFWWRATRGLAFEALKKLTEEEDRIWGSTDEPSPVLVQVTIDQPGKEERCAEYPPDKSFPRFADLYPPYALFPFQGSKKDGTLPAIARRGVRFKLRVIYPSACEDDVSCALKAWVNLGGIGARTRRGCGSLFSKDLSVKTFEELAKWVGSMAGEGREWPVVSSRLMSRPPAGNPMKAWCDVIDLYRLFRQGPGVGRNPGVRPQQPGRSRWPEADSLRRLTGKAEGRHSKSTTGDQNLFPRAQFGLPIVFHFKDAGDSPNDCEAYPAGEIESTRMASPLILKPLAISENSAVPLILRMKTKEVAGVRLRFDREVKKEERTFPVSSDANWPVGLAGIPAKTGPIDSFLAFAKQKGYKEI